MFSYIIITFMKRLLTERQDSKTQRLESCRFYEVKLLEFLLGIIGLSNGRSIATLMGFKVSLTYLRATERGPTKGEWSVYPRSLVPTEKMISSQTPQMPFHSLFMIILLVV